MNFNDILDTPVEEIKKPKLPPMGTYLFITVKHQIRDFSGADGTEYQSLEFIARGKTPGPDVDPQMMQDFGNASSIIQNISFMGQKHDEAAMEKAIWNAKRFIVETLGIAEEGKSFKQLLAESQNREFFGTIVYVPDKKNPGEFHANIKGTAAVTG